jgi:hypothetical protein
MVNHNPHETHRPPMFAIRIHHLASFSLTSPPYSDRTLFRASQVRKQLEDKVEQSLATHPKKTYQNRKHSQIQQK